MVWRPEPEYYCNHEAAKCKYDIVPYTRGKVLELGSGPMRTYGHFITFDNGQEYDGFVWKPDIIGDATDLSIIASKSFDAVFSSHLLEHIVDAEAALREWWRVIKLGGYLVLYLPHKDFYPNIGVDGSNIDHVHDFLPKDIIAYMKNVGKWDLVVSEPRNGGDEYSFLQVYKKIQGDCTYSYTNPRPAKSCGVVRYGGFGDMLQISALLPTLKELGYHVTLYTVPTSYEILMADPHIDEVVLQDKDQVPNGELSAFWENLAKKHDKFINLSESVEGTFLSIRGRAPFYWPHAARHSYMDFNYDEFAHLIAGVPRRHHAKHYLTADEKKWVRKERDKTPGKLIMWVLTGTSRHKIYPHMDAVIANVMINTTDINFVLVGGEDCQFLEQPWVKEPRVQLMSGKYTIRETLALATVCDMVIGPETGVLNAVSFEPVPKIIFLSHSSVNNLTRDWVNCHSLTPSNCPCYPCHKMVYTWDDCNVGPSTQMALCQENISPVEVVKLIQQIL